MCADRELRDLAARWTSPMSEQGFCLRDLKETFGCMAPHPAPQRTLGLDRRLDAQSFAGLLRMLKIHDHFDWKVPAELAPEAPGHLERGCADAREFFYSSTELVALHCWLLQDREAPRSWGTSPE